MRYRQFIVAAVIHYTLSTLFPAQETFVKEAITGEDISKSDSLDLEIDEKTRA